MKKICTCCNRQYDAHGNSKFCGSDCRIKFNTNKKQEKMNNALKEIHTTATVVKSDERPTATQKYAGKAWLRLYRVNQDLVQRGKIKLIINIDSDGRMALIESLTGNEVGSGYLFDEYKHLVKEESWSAAVFANKIITEYLTDDGKIRVSLYFQHFQDSPNTLKVSQMVPREAIAHFDTNIGLGESRTEQVSSVKNWLNESKKEAKLNKIHGE